MQTTETAVTAGNSVPWCFDAEHVEWQRTVRRFADEVVAPGALERSLTGEFPVELQARLGELGIFGLRVDPKWGGSGSDVTSLCIAFEQLARVDGSVVGGAQAQALTCSLLNALASDEQKEEVLAPAVRGQKLVAFGLTEPQGGSDAGNVTTRARRDGGDWVINGAKQFITNSGTPLSSHVYLLAATGVGTTEDGGGRTRRRPSTSAFLVPLDSAGVTVSAPYPKVGWRASDTHALYFDDVRVPGSALLGVEGRGYAQTLAHLTWARLPIGAICTGLGQGCLDATVDFVSNRESFGKRLGEHQAIAFDVADIAAQVAVSRTMTYDGCYRYDHGYPAERECAMVKLVAGELANRIAYQATQLHGGYGFIDESVVARHFRDARVLSIGEGTSHVQRMLIARTLGLDI